MITLAELAALHDAHREALARPVAAVQVTGPSGTLNIGDAAPTVMGVVNLSRDSSYRESVAVSTEHAVRMGRVQALQGAGMVDIGAESSDYGTRRADAAEQVATLTPVTEQLARHTIVSVETYEPEVAKATFAAGARVLNLTGREHEDAMLELCAEFDAAVVLCWGEAANVRELSDIDLGGAGADPFPAMLDHFAGRIARARSLGVERIIIDPAIGFYYGNLVDPTVRAAHQTKVLAQSFRLRELGVPVCNALPTAFDLFGEELRVAEAFFGVITQLGGTHVHRTHEVPKLTAVLGAMQALDVR